MKFEGVYTAILTPFTGEGKKIDYSAYEKLLEKQVRAGVTGVVPCGTTGESPTLSHDEHRELIRKTVEIIRGRIQVIAGTGSNSTAEAVELTADACRAGVDAVMVVNPYYNKPNQEGLFRHFQAVADASTKPVVVYNIKGRTAVNMEVETLERLSSIEKIQAVKEASGDPGQMVRIQRRLGHRFSMLSGDDNITPAVMGIGGNGVISVVSNLLPGRMVRMMNSYLQGDFRGGNQHFYSMVDLMNAMFWDTNPIPVKAAAAILGLCEPHLRLPLVPLDEEKTDRLRSLLEDTGGDI